MRKVFLIMLNICVMLAFCGCGNKSNAKLTDIEQFKCQDSIQTVFDVLGETELETGLFDKEYYKYENLNLWGYGGTACFNVRNNKDTIQSFNCNLTLNKKEFEEVLSYFSDKYGTYEVSDTADTIESYSWKIDDAEIGYDTISIQHYLSKDKEYTIYFSDEWSIETDEEYYKHLEEEKEINILAQKTYNIGEDTFNFSFGQKGNGEYSFTLLCNIEDKSDAYMTHISLNALFNSDKEELKEVMETMNFSYCIFIGDGTSIMRTNEMLYIMSTDKGMISTEDYFPIDWVLNEKEDSDYGTQVTNFLVDFMQSE